MSDQTRRCHIGACKSTILINIRPSDREAIGNIYGSLMLIKWSETLRHQPIKTENIQKLRFTQQNGNEAYYIVI